MRLNLATKITAAVVGVFAAATISALVAIVSAMQIHGLLQQAITENVPSVRAADELQLCLLEQRTLATSFVLDDGNAIWLTRLHEADPNFQVWFKRALDIAFTPQEREILSELDTVYRQFGSKQDEAIRLFDEGRQSGARAVMLEQVPPLYEKARALCDGLLEENEKFVREATANTQVKVHWSLLIVGTCIGITSLLSAVLLAVFYRGLLRPLRQMADELRQMPIEGSTDRAAPIDELRTIGVYLRRLMSDVAHTRSTLAESRFHLQHAEKLASVGRLAASVAHEIRNPLTAMRLWLFSLRRAVGAQPELVQRVDLLSGEITRLEGIVSHFLEFARPPVLQPKPQQLAQIVQSVLELFATLVEDQKIRLQAEIPSDLPPIDADLEQFKQVLINVLKNAIDAAGPSGEVGLQADLAASPNGSLLRLRLRNSGPPIPPNMTERIFEPFFTTKDSGTGLGLCIAARIMDLHGGRIEFEQSNESGTSFALWIPVAAEGSQA